MPWMHLLYVDPTPRDKIKVGVYELVNASQQDLLVSASGGR
jgi:hypothetical protein